LESSKAFAKAFMARHGVPTARFRTCESLDEAVDCVRSGEFGLPVVLKADGLAAGKGVVIAEDRESAERAIADAMRDHKYGAAGDRIVIEECLSGPEVSVFLIFHRTRRPLRVLVLPYLRRHAARADCHGAGSQASLRRRSGAEYRRHGRVCPQPAGGC